MKKWRIILSYLWIIVAGVLSPIWIGLIFIYLQGYGKGYSSDMGSESDLVVILGVVLLLLWLITVPPVIISLCRYHHKNKPFHTFIPLFVFLINCVMTVFIITPEEFFKAFKII